MIRRQVQGGVGCRKLIANTQSSRFAAERERLAYESTLKWLRQQGVPDPHEVLDIDDFTILIRSMCPDG